MTMRGKLTDDEKKQAVEMLKRGAKSKDIAAQFGISRQRVGQLEKELNERAAKAAEEVRRALKPDEILPGGAAKREGGYDAAVEAAKLKKPGGDPSSEKKPEAVPTNESVENEIDEEQVVEDLTDLMTGILLGVALFSDVDLDEALERAIAFSGAEKRRLVNWARSLVPFWKKWGTTKISMFVFFGMFSSMTIRKWQVIDREMVKAKKAAKQREFKPQPPGEPGRKEVGGA